eukprot:gene9862-11525_t
MTQLAQSTISGGVGTPSLMYPRVEVSTPYTQPGMYPAPKYDPNASEKQNEELLTSLQSRYPYQTTPSPGAPAALPLPALVFPQSTPKDNSSDNALVIASSNNNNIAISGDIHDHATFSTEAEMKKISREAAASIDDGVASLESVQDPSKQPNASSQQAYTGFNYLENPNPVWSTMMLEKHIKFPQQVTQRYLTANTKTLQGLFPEISRAWISIDQTLYLWDYKDNGGLITNHLSQIITTCGLVNPIKNVFKDSVRKVLVVSTHVEVFLFALSYSSDDTFDVITTPLVVPTDSVVINEIVGTEEGRIFMGGQDGCLYEIVYSGNSGGWFSSSNKIYKVNHTSSIWDTLWASKRSEIIQMVYDSKRQTLYTLSKNSVIQRYGLGPAGNQCHHLRPLKPLEAQSAMSVNADNMTTIVSIHTTPHSECALVAVLTNGSRLYMTDVVKYARKIPDDVIPHFTYYSNGIFFMAVENNEQYDNLHAITPFNRKQIKRLYEHEDFRAGFTTLSSEDTLEEKRNMFPIKGRINVIKEDVVNVGDSIAYFKEFRTEHSTLPRRFLCLNSLGLHIIVKLRFVDVFQNLLSLGVQHEIDLFYTEFGATFANSLCISLYCMTPQSAPVLADTYYGELSAPHSAAARIADMAMSQFKMHSKSPAFHYPKMLYSVGMGASVNRMEMNFSAGHNGVLAYLCRVLAGVWDTPLIIGTSCALAPVQLRVHQTHLANLLLFLENAGLVGATSGASADLPLRKAPLDIPLVKKSVIEQNTDEDARRNERRSLLGIKRIIQRSIQVVNLFLHLQPYNFTQVFESIDDIKDVDRARIHAYKFKDYVLDQTPFVSDANRTVPSALIVSCMRLMNSLNLPIEKITAQLESECPDLFNRSDKQLVIAKDRFNVAIRDGKNHFTDDLVREALEILDEISPHFNLREFVDYLSQLRYYECIVPLVQRFAQQLDPQGITDRPPTLATGVSAKEFTEMEESKVRAFENVFIVIDHIVFEQKSDTTDIIDIVRSPYISNFLYENDIDLCWKHYAKNNEYEKAAKILIDMAENEYKDKDIYLYAKRQIQVCNTQKKIVKGIQALLESNKDDMSIDTRQDMKQSIENLNKNIYDITTLFTDYARKYLLHEEMLYLVHIGNHDDQQFAKLLWKIIVEKYSEQADTATALAEVLRNKIVAIGYDFYPNEVTFPLHSIIVLAETAVHAKAFEAGEALTDLLWLTRSLHDLVHVDYWTLASIYPAMIEDVALNSSDERVRDLQVHLLEVYITLVELMHRSCSVSSAERFLFKSKGVTYTLELLKRRVASHNIDEILLGRLNHIIENVNQISS